MKIKKILLSLFITGLFLIFNQQVLALDIFARSPKAIEYGFDLMETFDDIQDWRGRTGSIGKRRDGILHSTYPKRIDGSDTPLNFYDWWGDEDPATDWIQDHRSHGGRIWDPVGADLGKSMAIDFSGLYGNTRFGTFFGSSDGVIGDHTYGYQEMYVFYMTFIPKELWPTCVGTGDNSNCGGISTDCNGDSNCGYYNNGDNYAYVLMKHQTAIQGFLKPWTHWEGPGSGNDIEYDGAKASYGWMPNVSHLIPRSGIPQLIYGDIHSYLGNSGHPCESEDSLGDNDSPWPNVEISTDAWIGIEIRYALNSRGVADGIKEMWYYDANGTEHHIGQLNELYLQSTCHYDAGDKWNAFYFGGNVSGTYRFGPGMIGQQYIDDFIIHGSRIGPNYFTQKLDNAICDSSHLSLCTTEITCSTATGHWCNNTCQSTPCPTHQYTLTITKDENNGTGTITSFPISINCGSTCSYDFDENTEIQLSATGDEVTWSGDCDSSGVVNIGSSSKSCTATFTALTAIRADVNQSGSISTADAMLILRNSLGLNMTNTNWKSSNTTGDVNCDTLVNTTDAMLLLRYSLELDMSVSEWCVSGG